MPEPAEPEGRPKRILIARGVDLPEQIVLGDRSTADLIVTISQRGDAVEHREGYEATFVDVDPAESALVECCERIKRAWLEEFPGDTNGHSAVGLWLFYWTIGALRTPLVLARQGRSDEVRASATSYIDSKFGQLSRSSSETTI